MVKEVVICDFCKKETKHLYQISIDLTKNKVFVRKYDLCKECAKEILDICERKEVEKDVK